MKKIIKNLTPKNAVCLTDLPSVGEKTAGYLNSIGILSPSDLISSDPYELYVKLCKITKRRFDPCLLDQFIAACAFMNGQGFHAWWSFTEERKSKFHLIENEIKHLRKFPDPTEKKQRCLKK